MKYSYLFSPIKIGSMVIRNRINFGPHLTNLSENHKVSERQIYYFAERARGGCGLITTEEMSVHPSDGAYERLIEAFDPDVIYGYQKLTKAVHKYGTKIFAQLNHNGMQANGDISRLPVWGPSPTRDPLFRETCKEMELEEIKECIEYFAKSAVNVVEGGFDGLELQLGHSSLIRQFLSPATNFRTDEYGGTFEDRLRFAREVIEAIRNVIGEDLPLGIRLNADEMHPHGGLTHADARRIAQALESTGQIDFIDISLGTFHNLFLVEGSMHTPLAYAAPLAEGIRTVVDIPVYASNRINEPHLAEKILEDGQGDVVNMVRGLIADPELPNKAWMGKEDDIRLCVGCNQGCIGRMALGHSIGCAQNPAAGNEKRFGVGTLVPSKVVKKVVIVGAGPAGLEAARVASLRHHEVILYERNAYVGGQNILASKLPGRQEIEGVTRWLIGQVNKLEVTLRLGVEATVEAILSEEPDAVIVATGSVPKERPFPGDYQPPEVVNVEQILKEEVGLGANILFIDCDGHHRGTGTAEYLLDLGKRVHVITPTLYHGSELGPLQDLFLARQRLLEKGVTCTPDTAVLEIQGTRVKCLNVYSNEMFELEGYDTVVLATEKVADDSLYVSLKGKVKELYRVGDCIAPRKMDMAIVEGRKIGRLV